ncbi:MAG TPA: hypothetical protein VLF59_05800 [Candidatus Saccharimonadales bacterium]|nr:hypothetical protein [Candidatus Saccharimonadales bacterium]
MEAKPKPTDTAKIYPSPVDQSTPEEKQQITTPMAMANLEIMKSESTKGVADQNPEVRNIALLFVAVLGITLFSQASSFLIVSSFNNTHPSFFQLFVSSNGFLGITFLLIQVVAIFILLFTRNISHAKTIILVTGISFGVTLLKGIFSLDIGPAAMANFATLVVNFLIFRKIFKLYLNL